ncbi:MAG: hypothetical protein EZS28_011960 [Streblomastix strix]|uniref:Uncharacterized protein n=1 Tax=Streblomastix strix TaxID=222440 RepID=A0A5J4WCW9_9EUKA|nr:MAG: hypothetical protein EZS28_011960 [Streblomastix strix]
MDITFRDQQYNDDIKITNIGDSFNYINTNLSDQVPPLILVTPRNQQLNINIVNLKAPPSSPLIQSPRSQSLHSLDTINAIQHVDSPSDNRIRLIEEQDIEMETYQENRLISDIAFISHLKDIDDEKEKEKKKKEEEEERIKIQPQKLSIEHPMQSLVSSIPITISVSQNFNSSKPSHSQISSDWIFFLLRVYVHSLGASVKFSVWLSEIEHILINYPKVAVQFLKECSEEMKLSRELKLIEAEKILDGKRVFKLS